MSAPGRIFADHVWAYRNAGWPSVLPLPPGQKEPPPKGLTGYAGRWPSAADHQTLAEQYPNGNISIRLPAPTIGLDVDGHSGKRGGETLVELEAKLGPLPPTIASTSRDDGVSRIRLYRVRRRPPGWRDAGTDIETVSFGWRYVMVWPSVHPDTGMVYRWVDERTGEVIDRIPRPEELPWLPEAWEEHLARSDAPADKGEVSHPEVVEWLRALPNGPACHATRKALEGFHAALNAGGSRHVAALRPTAALIRAGERGHHGVSDALTEAKAKFLGTRVDGRPDKTVPEWRRIIAGAVGIVVADPTAPGNHGCRCAPDLPPFEPDLGAAASNGAGAEQDSGQAGDPAPRGFPVLSRAQLRELPAVEWTIDGAVQYGEITLVFGQPKSAKSLIALDMGAHVAAGLFWRGRAVQRGHVVYVCLENKHALNPRLSAWEDAHPDSGPLTEEYFHAVVVPVAATEGDIKKLIVGIDENLPETPQLVIVDTAQRFAARAGLKETAEDASRVFALLDWLKAHYPCAVLLVHHAGKDLERGARGSNVYSGSPTTVLEASKPADSRAVKLRCTESNNARDGWEEHWNLAVTYEYDEEHGTPYLFPMLGPDGDGGDEERARARDLVDRIVKAVGDHPGITRNGLVTAVGGREGSAAAAIAEAVRLGRVVEEEGARRARIFYPADPARNV